MMYEIKNPAHLVHKEREKKAVLGGNSSIVYGSFSRLAGKDVPQEDSRKGVSLCFSIL